MLAFFEAILVPLNFYFPLTENVRLYWKAIGTG
jgi:hypothetical protein